MKTPAFWRSRNPIAILLLPLSALMMLAARLNRLITEPQTASVPVICIGNVTAGGAGKTPTVLALVPLLKELGYTPHILSRGYGGKFQAEPHQVSERDTAVEVGDEPLLLAKAAPCWVCGDRIASAEAAVAAGATLLIMDDGLQNPSLRKNLSLLVVSGAVGFGNGWMIPAGPLREPLGEALKRVQAVLLIGEDERNIHKKLPADLQQFTAELKPIAPLSDLSQPALAFAGLGYPEKFFAMLRDGGVELADTRPFPDHHRYTEEELASLRAANLPLITTAKDAVKLPEDFPVQVVDVALRFVDEGSVKAFLKEQLNAA